MFSTNVSAQIFGPITSTIHTHITKISRRPISPTHAARCSTRRVFRWKMACAITCSGYIRISASVPLARGGQIPKGFLRKLEFVPIAVDFCTETFIKLDATIIPLRDPPLDHPAATPRCFVGYSFHQPAPCASAAMWTDDIELLDDQVRFRPISER